MAADLQYWEQTARQILEHAESSKIVIEKSTLPVKTAQAMERILMSRNDGIHFDVLSNPEFLAEGTAIRGPRNARPRAHRLAVHGAGPEGPR